MGRLSHTFPTANSVDAALKRANKAEVDTIEIKKELSAKADSTDFYTEVRNLQSQIDEIVRAPESGGDVAAEVTQARVDSRGVTHSTLKERIDMYENGSYEWENAPQYSGYLNKINATIVKGGWNRFDKVVDPTITNRMCSELFSCDKIVTVYNHANHIYSVGIYAYDKDGNYDSSISVQYTNDEKWTASGGYSYAFFLKRIDEAEITTDDLNLINEALVVFEGDYNFASVRFPSLKDKKFSIMGDSRSTFAGYIPDGYYYHYPSTRDITNVEEMWWRIVEKNTGMILLKNDSCSSTTLSTGRPMQPYDGLEFVSDERINNLVDGDDAPDIVFVFGFINDFYGGVKLGIYDGNGTFPLDTSTLIEAMCILFSKIAIRCPDAKIVYIGECYNNHLNDGSAVCVNRQGVPLSAYIKAAQDACNIMNVPYVDISSIGVNLQNVEDYLPDRLHGNSKWHSAFAKIILNYLEEVEL